VRRLKPFDPGRLILLAVALIAMAIGFWIGRR
jgi:hypothetical protein